MMAAMPTEAACYEMRAYHAVEAFDANLTIKAYLCQVRQTVSIIGVGLVRSHVQRGLGMTRINANRR